MVRISPSKISLKTTLSAGVYLVGRDVLSGSYVATTENGTGNFILYSKSGLPKVNELLAVEDDGFSVTKVKFKVTDGETIQISRLKSVILQ